MNRKHFLTAASTLMAGITFPIKSGYAASQALCKVPPSLQPGDTIGITSPAAYVTEKEIESCIQILESWGYKIKIGNTIGKRDCSFGGTDEERLADFQQMLDDAEIKAILCARGGYGCVRIVDSIKWMKFIQNPKWVIGFSDITVMHNHIHQHCKVATIHSKMCTSFPTDWLRAEPVQVKTIRSIHEALAGKKMEYNAKPHVQNKLGTAEGLLVGGNLRIIENLAGSNSDIDTQGKILFVEDTGEYLYSIDRMFWNLKRTGKLKHLKGLVVGGFNLRAEQPGNSFGRTLQDIVIEKVKEYSYPVCFDFPVGHQPENFALKCGIKHRLEITEDEVALTETI